MEYLNLAATPVPAPNLDEAPVMKEYGKFVALAFGVSWLIWISAHRLGARPGVGEEILAFGSAGPAVAAIFLSRSRRKVPTVRRTTRLLWFGLLWAPCWAIYVVSDKMRGVSRAPSLRFGLIVALLAAERSSSTVNWRRVDRLTAPITP
jgi:glucose uptake protein GlcU